MTACTSFVAVDTEVSNATGQSTPMRVPVELPEGVTYEGVFGSAAAQTALGVRSGAPAAPMMESMRRLVSIGTVPKANGDLVRGQAMKPSERARPNAQAQAGRRRNRRLARRHRLGTPR